jgi:phosphoribosylformylglycinamidine synthase
MPHPEHAAETLTGPTTDGLGFFTSLGKRLVETS